MEPVDLFFCGTVITGDAEDRIIDDGAVACAGERIVAVGPRAELEARFRPARTLGGRHHLVHPGLVDCHQHAAQALVRSLIAHELPMIYRLYLPAEDAMTDDEVALSATLLQAQLLRSGVTTFAETTATPAHEEHIAAAVEAVGMRCSMARGAGDQDSHHAAFYSQITERSWARARAGQAEADLARTEAFLDRFDPSGAGRIKGGVLASHLTGCSPEYVRGAAALAERRGASLQVHAARDREEVEFCLAVFGRRPIEQLGELGAISERLLVIHAILATDREIGLLGRAGAAVAHQPVECLNILNGVPPVRRMLDAGVTVGLGCDNAINDGYEIMRAAWVMHATLGSIATYDPEHLPAETVFRLATRGGARALRWEHAIGSLEPGKQADVVVVDTDAAHLVPLQHPVVDLVRYGSRHEVQHVAVAGRLLVEDGAFTTIDAEALWARCREAGPRVAAVVEPRRYRPLAPRPSPPPR